MLVVLCQDLKLIVTSLTAETLRDTAVSVAAVPPVTVDTASLHGGSQVCRLDRHG